MIKKNQISAEITAARSTAVIENVNTITDTLKDVLIINHTADDRSHMLAMGDKTLAFVKKALEYAAQNEALCPAFLDLAEAQKDYELAAKLDTLRQKVSSLLRAIEDAEMVAGSYLCRIRILLDRKSSSTNEIYTHKPKIAK
ncbi:MAG: hypothetical protein ACO1N4_01050 [Pedobacter sp.]